MPLRSVLAEFDIKANTSALTNAGKQVDDLTKKLGQIEQFAGFGYAARETYQFVQGLVDTGTELQATATRLGFTTRELQQWQTAVGQSHVSNEEFSTSVRFMEQNIAAAARAGDTFTSKAGFAVKLKNADGTLKSSSELVKSFGLAIAGASTQTNKMDAAREVFGRGGGKMLSFFAQGKQGVEEMMGKLDEFGGGISDDFIKKAEEMERAEKNWHTATLSISSAFVTGLLPGLTAATTWAAKHVAELSKDQNALNLLGSAATTAGAVVAAVGASALIPWLPWIAAFGAITLVIEDLYVWSKGGKSALGPVIESLTGSTKENLFTTAKKDLKEFLDMAKGALGALSTVAALISGKDADTIFAKAAKDFAGLGTKVGGNAVDSHGNTILTTREKQEAIDQVEFNKRRKVSSYAENFGFPHITSGTITSNISDEREARNTGGDKPWYEKAWNFGRIGADDVPDADDEVLSLAARDQLQANRKGAFNALGASRTKQIADSMNSSGAARTQHLSDAFYAQPEAAASLYAPANNGGGGSATPVTVQVGQINNTVTVQGNADDDTTHRINDVQRQATLGSIKQLPFRTGG